MKQVGLDALQMAKLGNNAEIKEKYVHEVIAEFYNSARFNNDPDNPSWPKELQRALEEKMAEVVDKFREGLRDFLIAGASFLPNYWQKTCIGTVGPVYCKKLNITFSPLVLTGEASGMLSVLVDSINELGIFDFNLALDYESEPNGYIKMMIERVKIEPTEESPDERGEDAGEE